MGGQSCIASDLRKRVNFFIVISWFWNGFEKAERTYGVEGLLTFLGLELRNHNVAGARGHKASAMVRGVDAAHLHGFGTAVDPCLSDVVEV